MKYVAHTKNISWNSNAGKIKHETACTDSGNGGLKNVDIATKIIRLQCAWIKSFMTKASMTEN